MTDAAEGEERLPSRDTGPVPKELVPRVYADVVSPAALEIGATLGACVRTALRPVGGVVWSLDQALDWVGQRVTRMFAEDQTDPSDVVAPAIEIEGRILMSLQTAGPGDEVLRNMFAGLLGSAMTRSSAPGAHPGFVDTLRQLTAMEARLFAVVGDRDPRIVGGHAYASWQVKIVPEGGMTMTMDVVPGTPKIDHGWPGVTEISHLEFKDDIEAFDAFSNLERLGLISMRTVRSLEEFSADDLHTPWFQSVQDWNRKLWAFIEAGPGRDLPSGDPGVVSVPTSDGGAIRARSKRGVDTSKREFIPWASFECSYVQATRWGCMFAAACRTKEFVRNGRIELPQWAG